MFQRSCAILLFAFRRLCFCCPDLIGSTVIVLSKFATKGTPATSSHCPLVNRRDPTSGLKPPILKSIGIGLITIALVFLGTQLPTLQKGLFTTTLTPREWLICAGLAALLPLVVELGKLVRRRRAPATVPAGIERVVAPSRALTETARTDGNRTASTGDAPRTAPTLE